MTPEQFIAWRARMRLSCRKAAEALEVAPNTITAWENGRSPIRRHIALACAALAYGLSTGNLSAKSARELI